MLSWMKHNLESRLPGGKKKKIARRNINNLRYADKTTLIAEREEKEPLDEGEREE